MSFYKKSVSTIVIIQAVILLSAYYAISYGNYSEEKSDQVKKAETDLRIWKNVIESYVLDYMYCPNAKNIKELGDKLKKEGYWDNPVLKDPWNNEYVYEVQNKKCKI